MDYREVRSHRDYWSPESLQEWILKAAFHSQGHKPKCRCHWCATGDNLLAILETRPDLIHDKEAQCKGGCHHERTHEQPTGAA